MNRLFICVLFAWCGLTSGIRAQNQGLPTPSRTPLPAPAAPVGTAAPANPNRDVRYDVSFKGGRPQDLLKTLDAVRGEATPAIVPTNAVDIVFPPFELRNVTLAEVFGALNLLGMNENWTWQTPPMNNNGQLIWVLMKNKPNPNPYGNFQPQPLQNVYSAVPTPPEMKVQPIYVGYLLEKLKIEDLTTAIETGWAMSSKPGQGQAELPELKYHKDTELLFIKGYPAQISFVNEILLQLGNPLENAKKAREKSTGGFTKDTPK